jgi:hypothetical protein
MKLTISAKPFTADLKAVLPAVANRSGLPILSGVRLEALDDGLVIEATDLELSARRLVRGDVAVDAAAQSSFRPRLWPRPSRRWPNPRSSWSPRRPTAGAPSMCGPALEP